MSKYSLKDIYDLLGQLGLARDEDDYDQSWKIYDGIVYRILKKFSDRLYLTNAKVFWRKSTFW